MRVMATDPNIGRILLDRYKLVELAGKGAMGRVYRAEDILLGGVVAVKLLSQTLQNVKMRERFYQEARTCAQLGQKSIHIVRVTDYGVDSEEPFYVMEYLDGDSLSEVIGSQQLTLPRFLSITRQICLGLQVAHEGIIIGGKRCPIIHRDIKPSNILASRDSGLGDLVKILDFGIAKMIQEDGGQTSSYMGTLAYSSPEQMEGRELDARSDIYSLGIMMFEMLTGKMPLQVESNAFGSWYKAHHFQPPRTFSEGSPSLKLPRALETLVMSCLAKSPADRPQTVTEVLNAIEPLEQRYSANQQISQRLGEVLAKTPVQKLLPLDGTPSITESCQRAIWPKDKPIAQIVFPQTFVINQEAVATLWVMLPQSEIQNLQVNKLYNRIYKNFLCAMSPHPMVLWITAIYNQSSRWLRCYLDLKTPLGQSMMRLLGDKGQYYVLLFALENPEQCAHVIPVKLHSPQCLLLQEWAITSQHRPSIGQPDMSKNLLKEEFEKLKPQIENEFDN